MDRSKRIVLYFVLFGIFILFLCGIFYVSYCKKELKDFQIYGEKEITISYNDSYEEAGYTLKSSNNNYYDIKVNSTYIKGVVGVYSIDYVASFAKFFKTTLTRKVRVIDDVAPILEIDAKDEEYLSVGDKFTPFSYTATDEYEGDLTNSVVVSNNVNTKTRGDYKIHYEVSDSSGNKTEKDILVHVASKFDHTYIKISIKDQKLWYYRYNKVVLETPVTTGAHNATPTGNFKVLKKVRDTVLSGATYSSHVDYWMAFKGNSYGIHDASWRSKFGGSDYYYNGSHGCVNTPASAMAKLYNMVEVGTPVYIYK